MGHENLSSPAASISITISLPSLDPSRVGAISLSPSFPSLVPKIVGGHDVAHGQYPYQVNLRINGRFVCGGSIISSLFILTAAHCIYDDDNNVLRNKNNIMIVAGDQVLSRWDKTEQFRNISEIYMHPNYKGKGDGYKDDIAILELSKHLNVNNYIKPIECASSVDGFSIPAIVSGWGDHFFEGVISDTLQAVKVNLQPWEQCRHNYSKINLDVTDHMICAGSLGKDSCQGDSGGPLVCNYKGKTVLCGIVSVGIRCGELGYPGVYTDVAKFKDWISNIVKKYDTENYLHTVVGQGYNVFENRILSHSPFDLGQLVNNKDTTDLPAYSKLKFKKHNYLDTTIAESIIFPSTQKYIDKHLSFYGIRGPSLELSKHFKLFPGVYIYPSAGKFSFTVSKYLGNHYLNQTTAIQCWSYIFLDELRNLPSKVATSDCGWKQFFHKYGTNYVQYVNVGKLVEQTLFGINQEQQIDLMKKWKIMNLENWKENYQFNTNHPLTTANEYLWEKLQNSFIFNNFYVMESIYERLKETGDLPGKDEFKYLAAKWNSGFSLYKQDLFVC